MTIALATDACQFCGTSTANLVTAREMMYGTRERFTYSECAGCGCLRLLDIPADVSQYYPSDYYSFSTPGIRLHKSAFRRWLTERRNAGYLFGHTPLSWFLSKIRPSADFNKLSRMLKPTAIRSFRAKILDVGCGAGELLHEMLEAGFHRAVGVDPFVAPRTSSDGRLQILATTLSCFGETGFDLVMSHHSLEHMPDQIGMLRQMRRVLKDDGVCLIRIPIASSEVWRRYRENWVELDPPRHIVIHSQRSFEAAAEKAGLRVESMQYEDSGFGYWGSELYLADIPLMDPVTRRPTTLESHFDPDRIEEFERLAKAANARQDGGRACFYLRKL